MFFHWIIFPQLFKGLLTCEVMSVACLWFWVKVCLQWSALKSGVLVERDSSLPCLCGATSGTGRWDSWEQHLLPHICAETSPNRKNGQATVISYIPAVDVDTASPWGCIFVTTLMLCICLVNIGSAENVPIRKISLFWGPVFSFLLFRHLSGSWDWISQGLASSAGEIILKVSRQNIHDFSRWTGWGGKSPVLSRI